MGVDAGIFAKKHKAWYYFDRLYNLNVFDNRYGDDAYADIADRLFDKGQKVTETEILYLCMCNVVYWSKKEILPHIDREPNPGRAGWNENVIEFVKAHPGDQYFIADDYSDPTFHDLEFEQKYKRWETPEEIAAAEQMKVINSTCVCEGSPGKCPIHNRVTLEEVQALMNALSVNPKP